MLHDGAPLSKVSIHAPARELVQPRLGTKSAGEIEIDARLDEAGGDQTARLPVRQAAAHVGEDAAAVDGILARGEVNDAFKGSVPAWGEMTL